MTLDSSAAKSAAPSPIPEAERVNFLPRLFGLRLLLIGENTVYTFMGALCSAYSGGFWQFYETDTGALYMAPDGDGPMKLSWDGNGFEGEMSRDAAGIIATLFALSHMSMSFRGCEHLADQYHRLLDFAGGHEESRAIFGAID